MNEEIDELKIPDGIEKCEDKCQCGGNLRLHAHTFRSKNKPSKTKYYVDCSCNCGRVSRWHDSIESAVNEFDSELESEK